MIRVLVADDSAYMRYVLKKGLLEDPEIAEVEMARDGVEALSKIASLSPDVVTLDLEMPKMDGFEALKRIMSQFPVPVIILSSRSQEGADDTIQALRLGAVDFVPKPASGGLDFQAVREELLRKIKNVSGLDASKLRAPRRAANEALRDIASPARTSGQCRSVVVIGTSTGGPRALHELLPHLPPSLPAGVLVVQHMPPGFTRSLAGRLDEISPLRIKEAEAGDAVVAGRVLLAPGDYHMTVSRGGLIGLDQKPPEHGVRPAVDVTMEAAAQAYGSATLGVVLTGMGSDGTRGARLIKKAGGHVIAEDESTCVIYGMPRSAWEAGAVDKMVPLDRMATEIAAEAESICSAWQGPRAARSSVGSGELLGNGRRCSLLSP